MNFTQALGIAFKEVRVAKKLTQEDFGIVSSRTYISTIERGLKSVTIEKLNELCSVLNVHPMTIIAMAFLNMNNQMKAKELVDQINNEMLSIKK